MCTGAHRCVFETQRNATKRDKVCQVKMLDMGVKIGYIEVTNYVNKVGDQYEI